MNENMAQPRNAMQVHRGVLTALVALAGAACVHAQTPDLPDLPQLIPFAGDSGYQEIRLSADTWYLALHGTRKHSPASVQTAWLARAAQLCVAAKARYFVELRYAGERVLSSDVAAAETEPLARFMRPTAGGYYVPIFIPSGPRAITQQLTPSKLAPVRCVEAQDAVRERNRAMSAADVLGSARRAGFQLPP